MSQIQIKVNKRKYIIVLLITCSFVVKCSRFYCYFNLEMITKISCRVVQFIQCSDVAGTRVQKRILCKQNIILLKCSFYCF